MANFFTEDVFQVKGKGVVVTGKVEGGVIKKGMVTNINGNAFEIVGIEKFRDILEEAKVGEDVGLILKHVNGELDVDEGGFFQKLFGGRSKEYKFLKSFKENMMNFE